MLMHMFPPRIMPYILMLKNKALIRQGTGNGRAYRAATGAPFLGRGWCDVTLGHLAQAGWLLHETGVEPCP